MKNDLIKLGLIFSTALTVISCGGSSKEEVSNDTLKIGSTYAFFTQGCDFDCNECQESWKLKILDKENGELWSHFSSSDSPYSCKSQIKYSYQNETISILSINNTNISSQCKSSIKGDYKYNSSKKHFISIKNPDCNLNWYK